MKKVFIIEVISLITSWKMLCRVRVNMANLMYKSIPKSISFKSWESPTDELASRTPLETLESDRFSLFTEQDECLLSVLGVLLRDDKDDTDRRFLWLLVISSDDSTDCFRESASESLGLVRLTLIFLRLMEVPSSSQQPRSGEEEAALPPPPPVPPLLTTGFDFCLRLRSFLRLTPPSAPWLEVAFEDWVGISVRRVGGWTIDEALLLTSTICWWFDAADELCRWEFLSTSESELEPDWDDSSDPLPLCSIEKKH